MTVETSCYSVQAAANLAGISVHTLRAWEARYGVVEPDRAPSGHRRYGPKQVERLKTIASLVRRGHTIGEIAPLANRQLLQLLTAGADQLPSASQAELPPEAVKHFDRLLTALEKSDISRVVTHVKWLRTVLGVRDFVLKVAVPLFARVGGLVAASKLDVGQEHALSAVMRGQLGDIVHSLQSWSPDDERERETVVFATPEDDLHEFGILLGATLAGLHGMGVYYAGANLPAKNLADVTRALKAKLIVLGNAPVPSTERRQSFDQYLLALDKLLKPDVEIMIGGRGDRPVASLPSGRTMTYLGALAELDAMLAKRAV